MVAGPANTQIIRTRETLIETFAEEHHNLRFEMHDLVTVPLMTPSSKVLEVLLFFDVDTIWPDNSMQRVKQRIQLSWVVEGEQPFIRVCHVSNALDYDDRDVIYPCTMEKIVCAWRCFPARTARRASF